MPESKVNKVYGLLKKAGLQGLPDKQQFIYDMTFNKEKVEKIHGLLQKSGLQNLPDLETFSKDITGGYEQPKVADNLKIESPVEIQEGEQSGEVGEQTGLRMPTPEELESGEALIEGGYSAEGRKKLLEDKSLTDEEIQRNFDKTYQQARELVTKNLTEQLGVDTNKLSETLYNTVDNKQTTRRLIQESVKNTLNPVNIAAPGLSQFTNPDPNSAVTDDSITRDDLKKKLADNIVSETLLSYNEALGVVEEEFNRLDLEQITKEGAKYKNQEIEKKTNFFKNTNLSPQEAKQKALDKFNKKKLDYSINSLGDDGQEYSANLQRYVELMDKNAKLIRNGERLTDEELDELDDLSDRIGELRESTIGFINPETGARNIPEEKREQYIQEHNNTLEEIKELPYESIRRLHDDAYAELQALENSDRFKQIKDSNYLTDSSEYIKLNDRLNNQHNKLKARFDAINRTYLLNENLLSEENQGGFFTAFGETLGELTGSKFNPIQNVDIQSDRDLRQAFAQQVIQDGSIVLNKEEIDNIDNNFSETVGDGAAVMVDVIVELVATKKVVGSIGAVRKLGKLDRAIKAGLEARKGKLAANTYSVLSSGVQEAVLFELTPSEALGGEMGFAEGVVQEGLSLLNVTKLATKLGGRYSKLLEFGVRTAAAGSSEIAAEYSGELFDMLVKNKFDVDNAFDDTFGRTGDEAMDKLLLTSILSFGASATGSSARVGLNSLRALKEKGYSQEKTKQLINEGAKSGALNELTDEEISLVEQEFDVDLKGVKQTETEGEQTGEPIPTKPIVIQSNDIREDQEVLPNDQIDIVYDDVKKVPLSLEQLANSKSVGEDGKVVLSFDGETMIDNGLAKEKVIETEQTEGVNEGVEEATVVDEQPTEEVEAQPETETLTNTKDIDIETTNEDVRILNTNNGRVTIEFDYKSYVPRDEVDNYVEIEKKNGLFKKSKTVYRASLDIEKAKELGLVKDKIKAQEAEVVEPQSEVETEVVDEVAEQDTEQEVEELETETTEETTVEGTEQSVEQDTGVEETEFIGTFETAKDIEDGAIGRNNIGSFNNENNFLKVRKLPDGNYEVSINESFNGKSFAINSPDIWLGKKFFSIPKQLDSIVLTKPAIVNKNGEVISSGVVSKGSPGIVVNDFKSDTKTVSEEEFKGLKKETNLEKTFNFLDKIDKDLDKFGKETLGMNLPVATAKVVVKGLKAAVELGMTLEQAIKKVATDNNLNEKDVEDTLFSMTQAQTRAARQRVQESEGRQQDEKVKPSEASKAAKKVGRRKVTKVEVDEMKALKDQIRLEAKAAKQGQSFGKKQLEELNKKVREFVKENRTRFNNRDLDKKIATLSNLMNEIARTPNQVESKLRKVEEILEFGEFRNKVANANKLRKKIKTDEPGDVSVVMGSLKQMNPNEMSEELLDDYTSALVDSNPGRKQTPISLDRLKDLKERYAEENKDKSAEPKETTTLTKEERKAKEEEKIKELKPTVINSIRSLKNNLEKIKETYIKNGLYASKTKRDNDLEVIENLSKLSFKDLQALNLNDLKELQADLTNLIENGYFSPRLNANTLRKVEVKREMDRIKSVISKNSKVETVKKFTKKLKDKYGKPSEWFKGKKLTYPNIGEILGIDGVMFTANIPGVILQKLETYQARVNETTKIISDIYNSKGFSEGTFVSDSLIPDSLIAKALSKNRYSDAVAKYRSIALDMIAMQKAHELHGYNKVEGIKENNIQARISNIKDDFKLKETQQEVLDVLLSQYSKEVNGETVLDWEAAQEALPKGMRDMLSTVEEIYEKDLKEKARIVQENARNEEFVSQIYYAPVKAVLTSSDKELRVDVDGQGVFLRSDNGGNYYLSGRANETKTKSAIETPHRFDYVNNAMSTTKDIYTDYYVTPIIKKEYAASKRLKDEAETEEDTFLYGVIESMFRDLIELETTGVKDLLSGTVGKGLKLISKRYSAILIGSAQKAAVELAVNSMAVLDTDFITQALDFDKGNIITKNGIHITDAWMEFMEDNGSSLIEVFGSDTLTGKIMDSDLKRKRTYNDRVIDSFIDFSSSGTLLARFTDTTASTLLKIADNPIKATLFAGKFNRIYKRKTGKKFDIEKYLEDKKNGNLSEEEIELVREAVRVADAEVTLKTSPSSERTRIMQERKELKQISDSKGVIGNSQKLVFLANRLFTGYLRAQNRRMFNAILTMRREGLNGKTSKNLMLELLRTNIAATAYNLGSQALFAGIVDLVSLYYDEDPEELGKFAEQFTDPNFYLRQLIGSTFTLGISRYNNFTKHGLSFAANALQAYITTLIEDDYNGKLPKIDDVVENYPGREEQITYSALGKTLIGYGKKSKASTGMLEIAGGTTGMAAADATKFAFTLNDGAEDINDYRSYFNMFNLVFGGALSGDIHKAFNGASYYEYTRKQNNKSRNKRRFDSIIKDLDINNTELDNLDIKPTEL